MNDWNPEIVDFFSSSGPSFILDEDLYHILNGLNIINPNPHDIFLRTTPLSRFPCIIRQVSDDYVLTPNQIKIDRDYLESKLSVLYGSDYKEIYTYD